ncbi:hypothetical protein ACIBG7_43295 [Nonomuraea sp. NPDC050328]|uniref:hypothetical protein n=1 Tax=Nonomuraea sp. NPDC050328 TaxID=3364361 RepID=UPI0037AE50C3
MSDKRDYEPGTPQEVAALVTRLAKQPGGRGRRLLSRTGGRVDHRKADDVLALADELEASGATIGQVYKQGFPAATGHEDAIEEAVKAARVYGKPITAEVVQTPEHEEAGEFLVVVRVVDVDRGRGQPASQRPANP